MWRLVVAVLAIGLSVAVLKDIGPAREVALAVSELLVGLVFTVGGWIGAFFADRITDIVNH